MNVCIYGASSNEIAPLYLAAGEHLGKLMAEHNMTLVFGGGDTGMMGAVLRGVQQAGGKSIGVSPRFFDVPGILAKSCTEFYFTDTMRQRKQLMDDLADAFVMTPGSIGTYEEFFEILTLRQLKQTNKPLGIMNTNGFFEPLISMLRNAVDQKFCGSYVLELFRVLDTPEEVADWLGQCDGNSESREV